MFSIDDLGVKIRKSRKSIGLTIERFAELIDKSSSYVGLLERGERIPSLPTFCDILDVLAMSVEQFTCKSSETDDSEIDVLIRQLVIYISKLNNSQRKQLIEIIKTTFFFKK